jgi:hypothetical protein
MQTIEYRTLDKTNWGAGPWQDEPDKIQYEDADTGLPCLITRSPHMGNLCGYVGIAEGHPFFGVEYTDIDLVAHGDVNFSSFCQTDGSEAQRVCHVPGPGEPDRVWWFGFDCAHAGSDMMPAIPTPRHWGTYRDLPYVREQIKSLAAQLLRAEMKA